MEIQPSSSPALALQAKSLERVREEVVEAQAAERPASPDVIVELSQAALQLSQTPTA
jgi:hypothetical protein